MKNNNRVSSVRRGGNELLVFFFFFFFCVCVCVCVCMCVCVYVVCCPSLCEERGAVKCGPKSDRQTEVDTAAPHNARASLPRRCPEMSRQKTPKEVFHLSDGWPIAPLAWPGVCLAPAPPIHLPDSRASLTKGQRASVIERPLRRENERQRYCSPPRF